jgi:4-hydroxy-3-methylbut-2-enyl diphosphate reductase IspH
MTPVSTQNGIEPVTAGASTPSDAVKDLLDALGRLAPIEISALEARSENVRFAMPRSVE